MRIVIDMQGAQTGSRLRGIGRYTTALALAMIRHKGDHEIILALNGLFTETLDDLRDTFAQVLPPENIKVWYAVGPVHSFDPQNDTRKHNAELIREEFLASLEPDMVHVTSLIEGFGDDAVHSVGLAPFKIPTAVTFYDLIPLIQSDTYFKPYPDFERLYREKIGHLNRADLMLAISESSRLEARDYLTLGEDQLVNISAAVDDIFQPHAYTEEATQALQQKYRVRGPYLMYSGATDDRKNHLGLISAYALLPPALRTQYQLLLVGGLPDVHRFHFEQHILKCGLSLDDVIITGRVSDDELVQFYNQCALYIFASLHEGFGLPVLEAMCCGAAAIGSNTTSVPEILVDPRALFDPTSPRSMADKVIEVLGDSRLYEQLKANGPIQARRFSWDISARRTLEAFEQFHARTAGAPPQGLGAAARRTWLLQEIAASSASFSEDEMRGTAQSLALHTPVAERQLLVDVSGLAPGQQVIASQQAVQALLMALQAQPPAGFVVRPVIAMAETFGYRYASATDVPGADGGPVDIHAGDLFLGLAHNPEAQVAQAPFYRFLRRAGVGVYFMLYDLPLLEHPRGAESDASSIAERWLHLSRYMDGLMATSQPALNAFGEWHHSYAAKRVRPLRVGLMPLAGDGATAATLPARPWQESVALLNAFMLE
ncbi:glycosyltransferase family 1 protein [Pseudomonas sp. App30]|uniref:glycosyltransferase family 4 protein n=1 Tax=Pseudomonas sp. App30 TaxID=3068990 RepID=UPI003A7FD8AE